LGRREERGKKEKKKKEKEKSTGIECGVNDNERWRRLEEHYSTSVHVRLHT
jgi:hypothetical protein